MGTDSAIKYATLHIHPGDSSADALRQSGVPGEVLVWTELLHEGPTPLGISDEVWLHLRADFLAGTSAAFTPTGCRKKLTEQDEALARFRKFDEVVLWFDACLFDQTILIRQLDWFSRQEIGGTRISLLCVGEFPGLPHYRGLGELSPTQLVSLLSQRHVVTPEEYTLAQRAWQAFRNADPMAITTLLDDDTHVLPYLAAALRRHLQQFPSVTNGLNRLEQEALAVIANGSHDFSAVFRDTSLLEERPFFGDTTLWRTLMILSEGTDPALTASCADTARESNCAAWQFDLTDTGRELLAGHIDWIAEHGINRWLGGVHLTGHNVRWRWDGTGLRTMA